MDAEEQFQQIFYYFAAALRTLAMEADSQCKSAGNFNVAQELKYEVLAGQYLIGKGKLDEAEEIAIAALASAIVAVPASALSFAEGHASNIKNMMHPAWTPIRAQAVSLLASLDSRISENNKYYEEH